MLIKYYAYAPFCLLLLHWAAAREKFNVGKFFNEILRKVKARKLGQICAVQASSSHRTRMRRKLHFARLWNVQISWNAT